MAVKSLAACGTALDIPSSDTPFRYGEKWKQLINNKHNLERALTRPYICSRSTVRFVFSQRLGRYVKQCQLAALEEKVWEWSKEQPVIWNVGIGAAASFVPTLTRLLFERTKDIYGPYDHIMHVKLPPPAAAASSSAAQEHRLAFEVLTEMLTPEGNKQLLHELKQLAAEESYFGYGQPSDSLMLQAFGRRYIDLFVSDPDPSVRWNDPIYYRRPDVSPILRRVWEAVEGKRHLLLVENLHAPVSLDRLVFIVGERWPSIFKNRRWLISTTSKHVCEKSRVRSIVPASGPEQGFSHLTRKYYSAPPFDDLRGRDWAVLINEALQDAARSIYMQLQDNGYPVQFWLHVAQHCLYYGILYHPLQEAAGSNASNASSITSDELVRCWVAEDLLFSTATSTNTPAATSQKQSNYYRSAYEAGKIVIQALQEYSLLPIYSDVSTLAGSTSSCEETTSVPSSSQDAVTGVSKLAEFVPRLKKDELNTLVKNNGLRWVSYMKDHGRHVSWNWTWRETEGHVTMTTLIMRGCSNVSVFPFDKFLTPHLRVLDLSYTPINSLPPSFSKLLNLYLLSLRGCSQLEILSTPTPNSDKQTSTLAHLEKLEALDMNGVPLLELTQQDCGNKSNLHYLDLSGSKFTTLPSEFFCEMSSLEDLIFGNCTNLIELPPSMAQLSNLLVLHVEGTQITSFPRQIFQNMQILHTLKLISNILLMSLPVSLSEAKGLKELHISNCISLPLQIVWELLPFLESLYIQTWEALEDIKILRHPNLRTFSLSGPWVRCLSLYGCSKLKSVNFSDDLTALEGVDLSGTAIQEVPHNLPNLPHLNMLILLGVPCSMRFPWHILVRFPKVFYLVHCANDYNQIPNMFCQQKLTYGDENQHKEETTNTAHIKIDDPRMFYSFNAYAAYKLVMKGHFLQSFNVQVKPCSVTGKKPRNNELELSTRIQRCSTYSDVQYSEVASIMPMMMLQPKQRHVEISAKNQYPNGLRHILSVTNSIFITDDAFVGCLTDLNYSLNELEECKLQRCHQMTVVFLVRSYGSVPHLQILQVFDLNNLLSLVEPSDISYSKLITLKLLKHIHLEHCPRLEKLFPCSLSLPALETLVILFCSNLKTIFYKQPLYEVARSPLPNIKRIYLQELPQLQHIYDDVMFRFETPNWEKLFVRGCRSFRRLPLLKKEYPKSKVEVSGEREWWDRLQLKLPEQSHCYLHVAPPEFVSRKKHIIESYLR
ncbi:unnamed protein product [Miscanthus lutarioriparius]|uniref:Uncharacterized protein n=1 Tax=Miscanthus lutarioriparius TaxID=422564 RepID=A0A811QCK6_9POAL|nr:unnamed protein product [Miscanthus lutarioriparius]